jgi:hypothetical protein
MDTHECLLSLEPASSTTRCLISDRPLPALPGLAIDKDSDAIQHPFGMTGRVIDLFPLGFVLNESIRGAPTFGPLRLNADACLARCTSSCFLIAQGDRGTASPDREQLIKTHRVSDPDNITGGIVVEPQGDVKIHLLIWSEAIQSAPIQ